MAGQKGYKGEQGADGPRGKQGKTGPDGPPGLKGQKGAPGLTGLDGLDGAKVGNIPMKEVTYCMPILKLVLCLINLASLVGLVHSILPKPHFTYIPLDLHPPTILLLVFQLVCCLKRDFNYTHRQQVF